MPLIAKLLAGLALLYVGLVLGMRAQEREFVYLIDPERVSPAAIGLSGVSERVLTTADDQRIVAWTMAAQAGKPTLLYFHGNGGNLAVREQRIKAMQASGYGLLMMAYRGYSGSTGTPSETAIAGDARLAYDTLLHDGIKPANIVVYGESLGTGVAVTLASQVAAGAVILDAPYTSLPDVAAGRFWYLPVRFLMRERYNSLAKIKSVHAPLLILHGEFDPVIPVAMGKAMFAAANEPKRMVVVPGGGHSNLLRLGAFDEVRKFVDALQIARQ